ncbi:MAG: hypothetical protein OEY61_08830 [Gammaproteobacteria bacterium]|nr:hypothetical protein [Gammaproteobacteria bacterium]
MKIARTGLIILALLSTSLSGCITSGSNTSMQQNSVLVSELMAICGAIVGEQAEQRINQEWAKYPDAQANRTIIESVAETLLNDPGATAEQRTRQYRQYLTCATGVLVTKGIIR